MYLPDKFGRGAMKANGKYKQGLFRCQNPDKYIGNPNEIVYRSSLEFKYMMFLDQSPEVLKWASEEFHITYISPKDRKPHRYFLDFLVYAKDGTKYMVEIKPDAQTKKPKSTKNKRAKTLMNEAATYAVNEAKWAAATKFAKEQGFEFQIITEKDLGVTYRKK